MTGRGHRVHDVRKLVGRCCVRSFGCPASRLYTVLFGNISTLVLHISKKTAFKYPDSAVTSTFSYIYILRLYPIETNHGPFFWGLLKQNFFCSCGENRFFCFLKVVTTVRRASRLGPPPGFRGRGKTQKKRKLFWSDDFIFCLVYMVCIVQPGQRSLR